MMGERKDLPPEKMFRVLEMESIFLDKLHGFIADELHRLQVEEGIYVRSLSRMKAARRDEQEELDREVQEAMSTELENSDNVPQPEEFSDALRENATTKMIRDSAPDRFAVTGNLPEGHEIVPIRRQLTM